MRYAQTAYPPPPGGVSNNNAEARGWGPGYPDCQRDRMRAVELYGGAWVTVHEGIVDLVFYILSYCSIAFRYPIRAGVTGGFNCRAISGTSVPSNHSWGLAVDVNWDKNPMSATLVSDIPPGMVSVMWAHGFFWGGWYGGTKDAMHFEFVRTPGAVATLEANAKRLWEAVMTLENAEKATLFNAFSAISSAALMHDTADQRYWNGDVSRHNRAAPPLALPITRYIREIHTGVGTLVGRPAGPVVEIDYAQLAAALVPHLRQAVKDVLAGATIETDIIIPEANQ